MAILSYADWTADSYAFHSDRNETLHITQPLDKSKFFDTVRRIDSRTNTCIYCQCPLTSVLDERGALVEHGLGRETNQVHECKNCGWWNYEYRYERQGYVWHRDDTLKVLYRGIVKRFALSSSEAPINDLRKTISRTPSLVYKVSPKRMEELVRYCFESYFRCNVKHCGRSHDGGFDLVVVESDEPILVQVKRRGAEKKSEGVAAVRELLGVMVIQRTASGIFVTTAPRFSSAAMKARNKVIHDNSVRRFDLIDLDRLMCLLRCAKRNRFTSDQPPWHKAVQPLQCMANPDYDSYKVSRDSYGVRREFCRDRLKRKRLSSNLGPSVDADPDWVIDFLLEAIGFDTEYYRQTGSLLQVPFWSPSRVRGASF
jgi:restriction system protein